MINRVFILSTFLVGLLSAQDFEVTVTTIQVWVKATQSGKPVTGLTVNDFEVSEDGKKMAITCFESTPQMGAEAPTKGPDEEVEVTGSIPNKKIAIYVDLFNTTGSEFENIKPRLEEFLDQIASRNWDVMLSALSSSGKLDVLSPFTKDVEAVRVALTNISGDNKRDMDDKARVREVGQLLERVLEKYPPRVEQQARMTAFQAAMEVIEVYAQEDKNSSQFALDALGSFTAELSRSEAKEHIIVLFISGGINLDPGHVYYDMASRVAEQVGFAEDAMQYEFMNTNRDHSDALQKEIQKSIGKLNRQNVTIYSISTRGLYIPDNTFRTSMFEKSGSMIFKDYQDSLIELAEETGGVSFENSQNFKVGFDKILMDLGEQYLLCYNSPEHKKPGEFHKIKVESKKKGVQLRYRKGYLDQ